MTAQVALPAALLGMSFLLKLFVDRTTGVPELVQALLELPVSVIFLATSFIAAFIIANPSCLPKGLVYFPIFVCVAILAVFLWRRSIRLFDEDRFVWSTFLAVLNYTICGYALILSVNLLTP
jgi:hypothetical protein